MAVGGGRRPVVGFADPAERRAALRADLDAGMTITAVSKKYGVSWGQAEWVARREYCSERRRRTR